MTNTTTISNTTTMTNMTTMITRTTITIATIMTMVTKRKLEAYLIFVISFTLAGFLPVVPVTNMRYGLRTYLSKLEVV